MKSELLWFNIGIATGASAACTRSLLQNATTAYISAQTSGNPSLLALSPNTSYTENESLQNLTHSLLSQPLTIDLHRSIYDTIECIAFTEIDAANNPHPYVIDTRLIVSASDGNITAIESVVADAGDWIFNATTHLKWAKQEHWDTIPTNKLDTRAVIKAAGDAYLDSWSDGKVSVPYGTPCARLEGGMYTGEKNASSNTCTMPQFPESFKVDGRRYVVDVEMGALAIFDNFPFIDVERPNGTASVNFFRVEGGKIRYIHETTICSEKNCGR